MQAVHALAARVPEAAGGAGERARHRARALAAAALRPRAGRARRLVLGTLHSSGHRAGGRLLFPLPAARWPLGGTSDCTIRLYK